VLDVGHLDGMQSVTMEASICIAINNRCSHFASANCILVVFEVCSKASRVITTHDQFPGAALGYDAEKKL
jgi:hypothetical protein